MGSQKNRLDETVTFEHPKHMFKLMDKKIIAILRKLFLLNWPYGILHCRAMKNEISLHIKADPQSLPCSHAQSIDVDED